MEGEKIYRDGLARFMLGVVTDAGKIIRDRMYDLNRVDFKSKNDPVTELDRDLEVFIKKSVVDEYSPQNFIGEEFGVEDNGAISTWYIDPLDGTKSFLKRIFESAISIGVEVYGNINYSCVYDFMRGIAYIGNPKERKLYFGGEEISNIYADSDKFSNREILTCSNTKDLVRRLAKENSEIRGKHQNGSIALSLAQVAYGVYDGIALYNPGKGGAWDTAAGYHLLKVGGDFEICDYFGNEFDFRNPENGLVAVRKSLGVDLEGVLNDR